jgi:hypothetical protein
MKRLLTAFFLLGTACGALVGCAKSTPQLKVPTGDFDPVHDCVDLTARDVPTAQVPLDLGRSAAEDAKASGKMVSLYKVLPSRDPDRISFVFSFDRSDDVYLVYAADRKAGKLTKKFTIGSLHYRQDNEGCRGLPRIDFPK